MTVLVTGAAGFIGSHLTSRLIDGGYKVRCLIQPKSDESALRGLRVQKVYGDLREPSSLRKAVSGVERVYHLAALARLYAHLTPADYEAVNVQGTRNLLEVARKAHVKRFLYTSSIEAVGPSPDRKLLTENSMCAPTTVYGKTKLGGELAAREYGERYPMETVVVRPPMTYGPRNILHAARLFGIASKGFYPVIGNGKTLMEFCYVANQVEGMFLAGEKQRAGGQTYFISDERSYRVIEVLKAIEHNMEKPLRIIHLSPALGNAIGFCIEALGTVLPVWPLRVPETGRPVFSRNTVRWTSRNTWVCSTAKARRELGWRAPVPLDEGVRRTLGWYKEIGAI